MRPTTEYMRLILPLMSVEIEEHETFFYARFAGEEYKIERHGLRLWCTKRNGHTIWFYSQYKVILWIDSQW